MRLGDLYGAQVESERGEAVGRVFEVYAERGRVVALGVGTGSFLERLFGGGHGRRVAWDEVVAVEGGRVVVRGSEGA